MPRDWRKEAVRQASPSRNDRVRKRGQRHDGFARPPPLRRSVTHPARRSMVGLPGRMRTGPEVVAARPFYENRRNRSAAGTRLRFHQLHLQQQPTVDFFAFLR